MTDDLRALDLKAIRERQAAYVHNLGGGLSGERWTLISSDIPALLAALEAAEREIERLRAELEDLRVLLGRNRG